MRKRIAVIMPELYDFLEIELIDGIHETAKALGYDVIIITDTYNGISDSYATAYVQGQESIYQLLSVAANARLERAKWLLTHTELHVTEIAEQVGFGSNAHFMRQFRSRVGMTAMEYRRK